jgi:hypothetical protein
MDGQLGVLDLWFRSAQCWVPVTLGAFMLGTSTRDGRGFPRVDNSRLTRPRVQRAHRPCMPFVNAPAITATHVG